MDQSNETTAQQLCRDYVQDLTKLQRFGATFNFQMLSMVCIEVQFADGEKILVSFSTPKQQLTPVREGSIKKNFNDPPISARPSPPRSQRS